MEVTLVQDLLSIWLDRPAIDFLIIPHKGFCVGLGEGMVAVFQLTR